jgi:hypothetical protein
MSSSSFLLPSFCQHLLSSPQDDAAVAAAPPPPPPVPVPTVAGPNCKDQARVSAAVVSPAAVAASIVAQQEPSSSSTSTFLLAKATPVTDSQINEELVQLGQRNRELQFELERLRPSPPPPPRPPTNRSATSLLFLSKTQQMVQFGMGIAFTVAVTIAMGICALLMILSACIVGGTAAFNKAIRSTAATTAREPAAGVPMASPTLKLEAPTVSPVVSSTESPTTRLITTTASTSTAAPISCQSVYINAGGYSPYEDAAGRV